MVVVKSGDQVVEALRQGLRQSGYIEGKNFTFEFRTAEGRVDRLPSLARELVGLHADVIITGSDAAVRAAKQATSEIPIIMAGSVADPVATGLIKSFSHPGGNLTGTFVRLHDLIASALSCSKKCCLECPVWQLLSTSWDAPNSLTLHLLQKVWAWI